jgi:hypothetical protein
LTRDSKLRAASEEPLALKVTMYNRISDLQNYTVEAIDSPVGNVGDFYFLRGQWIISYLLLNVPFESRDSGVLISTGDINEILHNKNVFLINLSSEQVRDSPEIDVSQPISRKHEIELLEYYGWPADWLKEEHDMTPIGELSEEPEREESDDADQNSEPDLLSCDEITGLFQIQANDSEVGKLTDFIVDEEDWIIRYLAAQFQPSPTGYILLPTGLIDRVDWIEAQIYLNASLANIELSPNYDPSKPLDQKKINSL